MHTQENRNKVEDRPLNDFYQTPKCITWELYNNYLKDFNKDISILDPCCGLKAITNELHLKGFNNITATDLSLGDDFLKQNDGVKYDMIVMNPPFKDFDDFIYKAKEKADVVCSVGRLNFFGAHNRNINGLWKNLKYVLVFDRQIAYDRPFREDGKVEAGMLISGWFIWDKNYNGEPTIKVIDVQQYMLNKKEKGNFENLWEEN